MGKQEIMDQDDSSGCETWVPPPELNVQWPSQPHPSRSEDRQSLLSKIIENDVIPRLLLANSNELAISPTASNPTAAKLAERIGEFSELVVNRDAKDSIAYFENLRDQGVSLEALFQDLIAPTAARLGELWDEDINDFMDVTRGVGHLQEIIRTYSVEFCDEGRHPVSNRRALLMPLPGDQHTFGISLLREHFLREGWRVWCGHSKSTGDMLDLVKGQWFDMVGLSASVVKEPAKLAADIALIRKVSLNKGIAVFVGGHAFVQHPGLVSAVGADATASDGQQAVLKMNKLIDVRQPTSATKSLSTG